MRILVVEDNPKFQKAAREGLVGHDVVIAESYLLADLILNAVYDKDHYHYTCDDTFAKFDPFRDELNLNPFDIVITDVLLPANMNPTATWKRQLQNPDFNKKEIKKSRALSSRRHMYGIFICLSAARYGVQHIAVVTSPGHGFATEAVNRLIRFRSQGKITINAAEPLFTWRDKSKAESWADVVNQLFENEKKITKMLNEL